MIRLISTIAISISCVLVLSYGSIVAQDRSIIEKGKASVALVEAGASGNATAFCIDPLGIFVTNHHVVDEIGLGGNVKLIMNSSETNEWELMAEVASLDSASDLALLRAYSIPTDKKLVALEIAREPNLFETMNLVAFGFPFGKQLTVEKGSNPSISVSVGKLTAIRREKGAVELIQLDATLNPGNSGGPVIDETGKVVGIVSFGVLSSGVNFAIPVEKLIPMLRTPFLTLDAPGLILDPFSPCEVKVGLISIQNEIPDAQVEFWYKINDQGQESKVDLKLSGKNEYRGSVSPIKNDPKQLMLDCRVAFENGEISGTLKNENVRVSGKEIWLSSVATLNFSTDTKSSVLFMKDGTKISVDPATLPSIQLLCGGIPISISLSKVTYMEIRHQNLEKIGMRIVVKSQGKEILNEKFDESFSPRSQALMAYSTPDDKDGSVDTLNSEKVISQITRNPLPTVTAIDSEQRISTPHGFNDAVRAGGGRFLLLPMNAEQELGIVDVYNARLATVINLPSVTTLVAGTKNHFFLLDRLTKRIERYSLDTFEREAVALDPFDGIPTCIASGETSEGPLMICGQGVFKTGEKVDRVFVDPVSLKPISVDLDLRSIQGFDEKDYLGLCARASADGKVFTTWSNNKLTDGFTLGVLRNGKFLSSIKRTGITYAVPSSDGKHILSGLSGIFNRSLDNSEPYNRLTPTLFLTSHPDIYISTILNDSKGWDTTPIYSHCVVRHIGFEAPLAILPSLGFDDSLQAKGNLTVEKRIFLDIQAGLLTNIDGNSTLRIQPFNLREEMRKTGLDYLVVSAPENKDFAPGTPYQASIGVETNRENIGYKLISAPSGMRITQTGRLVWKVPEEFKESKVDVIVSINHEGIHQKYLTFGLTKAKEK